jgi:hypothetical protein
VEPAAAETRNFPQLRRISSNGLKQIAKPT